MPTLELDHLRDRLGRLDGKCAAAAYVSGSVVFPASILLIQRLVLAPVRVCAHQKIFGTFFGGVAVGLSAIVASETARATYTIGSTIQRDGRISAASLAQATTSSLCAPMQSERWSLYAAGGVALFMGLGGRLRWAAPSSLVRPGAFAGKSLPATQNYADTNTRERLQLIGRASGCHTCGVRRAAFVGDHMPPLSLARPGQAFRFYPQCAACSSLQGGSLATGRVPARPHRSLRLYHAWAPAGLAMAAWLRLE